MTTPSARPRRSLATNSQWNLVAYACTLAANFVTVPFVVKWIGLSSFGQAGLVLAVCAPMMLIGTVLAQGLVSRMSVCLGSQDEAGAQRMVDAAMRLCLVAGLLGWLLLAGAGPSATEFMMHQAQPSPGLATAFVIAATGWFAQQFVLVLQGVAASRQDYPKIARLSALTGILAIVATLTITSSVPTIEGYLLGTAAGFGASLTAWLVATRRDLRGRAILRKDRRKELQALLHFGKWQSIAQVAGQLGNQIDRYVLGALAPASVIGQYNVAMRLQEAAYIGLVKGSEVLLPHFGRISAETPASQGRQFLTASWVVGTFGAIVLAPMGVLSNSILTLWVGAEAANGGAFLLRTLVLGGIVGCSASVFSYYAMGIGRNAPIALVSAIYSVLVIAFSALLIFTLGPLAAGAGLLIASAVRMAICIGVTRREFFPGMGIPELFVSTAVPAMVGVLVAVCSMESNSAPVADSWFLLALFYAAFALLTLAGILAITLASRSGQCFVKSTLRSLSLKERPSGKAMPGADRPNGRVSVAERTEGAAISAQAADESP